MASERNPNRKQSEEGTYDDPPLPCVHCGRDPYSINYQTDKLSLENWKYAMDLMDSSLELAYKHWGNDEKPIRGEVLEGLQIDFDLGTVEKSERTGKEVVWFNYYGLQNLDEEKTHFMILCRKTF